MGGSILGYKADAFMASVTHLLNSPALKKGALTTASFVSFASVAMPICTVTSTVSGVYAQMKLQELGAEITEELKKIAKASEITNSLQYQAHFAQHVYDFTSARIRASEPRKACDQGSHYFFVFHPGTDWHAAFESLIIEKPLPNLLGYTHSLDLIGLFVAQYREKLGPKATVHILLPSAHMYIIPESFTVPKSLFPIVFEGELAHSAQPYVYLNMPGLSQDHFHQIGRVPQPRSGWRRVWNGKNRDIASTSAAVPAGVAGGMSGVIGGAVGLALLTPVGLPLVIAGGLAAGAMCGTASAMGAGTAVEKAYDATHQKKEK